MTEDRRLGVAEAKRRFSELLDRVQQGERFVVERHGKPVVALVSPGLAREGGGQALGLAAFAGALAEWKDIDEFVEQVYRERRKQKPRPVQELG